MGRLKDLEAENIELKKQVEFFRSWLDGEVSQTDSAELNKMRRDLTAARGAASALETELNVLNRRFETMRESYEQELQEARWTLDATTKQLQEEAEAARQEAHQSAVKKAEAEKAAQESAHKLAELTEEHERLVRRAEKGPRKWHFICDPKSKKPQPGEYVLVCAFAMSDTMQQIADKSSRVSSEFLIRDSFYRVDKNGHFDFVGLPVGYVVMAWQPLVEPDWSLVSAHAMAGLKSWSNDTEGRARELERARKKGGAGAEAKLREVHDRVRAALEKGTYKPTRDRVGKDLIFMRGRAAGEGKVV